MVPPTAFWIYGDKYLGFKIEVTDPSGAVDTLGPFTSDDIGGFHISYTPDTAGTYYVQFFYPGQTLLGINPGPAAAIKPIDRWAIIMMPSNSPKMALTVQQAPIEPRPTTPLPTNEYWTRPINGMNPEWTCIAGDWLGVDPGSD